MKPQGYTLIELLLVIAILAIISAAAIIAYHQAAENNRVDQAALEMQQVLEAAIAFNVASGASSWPIDNKQIPLCNPTNPSTDSFILNYLPNRNYISTYGNNFCWAVDAANLNSSLFWVALKMPFTDAHHNAQLANRIAARLPSGIALVDPTKAPITTNQCTDASATCYVRAEVALPSTQSNGNTNVVGLGYCDPAKGQASQPGSTADVTCIQNSPADHYTIQFTCPSGQTGQVYLMPNFYKSAALRQMAGGTPTIITILGAKTENNSCHANPNSQTFSCPIAVTALYDSGTYSLVGAGGGGDPGTIGVTYIAYCVKLNSTKTVTRW